MIPFAPALLMNTNPRLQRWLIGIGAVAVFIVAAFTWHALDKGSAVRRAVIEYVAHTELAVATAEKRELQRRVAVYRRTNSTLNKQLDQADADNATAQQEIADYVEANKNVPSLRVGDDLFSRLRAK